MKNVFLKRMAIIVIAAATMSMSAAAQRKGDMAAGVNLLFGTTSGYSNLGFGGKFMYNVTDPIQLAGEFDYFLKKNHVSFWDASIYGRYLFPVAEKIFVYPAVGIGVLGSVTSIPSVDIPGIGKIEGNASTTDFAFSLGGGAEYKLTSDLALNAELRLKLISGGDTWFNFLVGIAYKF